MSAYFWNRTFRETQLCKDARFSVMLQLTRQLFLLLGRCQPEVDCFLVPSNTALLTSFGVMHSVIQNFFSTSFCGIIICIKRSFSAPYAVSGWQDSNLRSPAPKAGQIHTNRLLLLFFSHHTASKCTFYYFYFSLLTFDYFHFRTLIVNQLCSHDPQTSRYTLQI